MERLIDPAMGDVQLEYEAAKTEGRVWHSRWILVVGSLAFLRAIAYHWYDCAISVINERAEPDRSLMNRSLFTGLALISAAAFVLMLPVLFRLIAGRHSDVPLFAMFLLPQALTVSIPVGLALGMLRASHNTVPSKRALCFLLVVGTIASVLAFTLVTWIVPAANQGFREAVAQRAVPKGLSEFTLGELHERAAAAPSPTTPPTVTEYQKRLASSLSPLVLSILAMAAATARDRRKLVRAVAYAVMFGYYPVLWPLAGMMFPAGSSQAYTAPWLPSIAVLLLCAAVPLVAFGTDRAPYQANS